MSRWVLHTAAIALPLIAWILYDSSAPGPQDLRMFNPHEVACLETEMWRSYYEGRRAALFFQMSSLLRSQYGFRWLQSQLSAFEATRAAFVFQKGSARPDYELALPALRRYYSAIERRSRTPFDVNEAARLELEWWIIHRERARYGRTALEHALAELQSSIFQQRSTAFHEHAAARAAAMLVRDELSARGSLTNDEWQRIQSDLDRSWTSLHAVVESASATAKRRQ